MLMFIYSNGSPSLLVVMVLVPLPPEYSPQFASCLQALRCSSSAVRCSSSLLIAFAKLWITILLLGMVWHTGIQQLYFAFHCRNWRLQTLSSATSFLQFKFWRVDDQTKSPRKCKFYLLPQFFKSVFILPFSISRAFGFYFILE